LSPDARRGTRDLAIACAVPFRTSLAITTSGRMERGTSVPRRGTQVRREVMQSPGRRAKTATQRGILTAVSSTVGSARTRGLSFSLCRVPSRRRTLITRACLVRLTSLAARAPSHMRRPPCSFQRKESYIEVTGSPCCIEVTTCPCCIEATNCPCCIGATHHPGVLGSSDIKGRTCASSLASSWVHYARSGRSRSVVARGRCKRPARSSAHLPK
jgi:hypothetical protein